MFRNLALALLLATLPLSAAENVSAFGPVARANISAVGPVAIANVSAIGAVDNTASAPTPDILKWQMSDGSGTTITALVGPNGTTDADWTAGPVNGNALDFNGTSDDAFTTSSLNYSASKIATVAFWFWADSTAGTQIIFESGNPFFSAQGRYIIYFDSGNINLGLQMETGLRHERMTAPATGQWIHLLSVFDGTAGTGDCKLYLDGASQTLEVVSSGAGLATAIATEVFSLGSRASGSLFFDGRVGKTWIYSTDESAEVTAIKDAQE